MSARTIRFATIFAALTLVSFTAAAADVRVTCEKRANRSKISVDGNNLLPGTYFAIVESGGVTVNSRTSQAAVGDEVEFDFDSNRNDIAAGATAIPTTFIVDGLVKARIMNGAGVVAVGSATCRVRSR